MANLSEAAMLQPTVTETNQITGFLDGALTNHPPVYEFLLPDLQVFTYPINATLSAINLPNQFILSFDSSFVNQYSGYVLKMAFIRYNVFLPITPGDTRTASPIAMVWVERNGMKITIADLGVPFNISFPLD